jgi:hypothetical protein
MPNSFTKAAVIGCPGSCMNIWRPGQVGGHRVAPGAGGQLGGVDVGAPHQRGQLADIGLARGVAAAVFLFVVFQHGTQPVAVWMPASSSICTLCAGWSRKASRCAARCQGRSLARQLALQFQHRQVHRQADLEGQRRSDPRSRPGAGPPGRLVMASAANAARRRPCRHRRPGAAPERPPDRGRARSGFAPGAWRLPARPQNLRPAAPSGPG